MNLVVYIEAYDDEGEHSLILSLRITITNETSYGEYLCVASNALGSDQGVVHLVGRPLPRSVCLVKYYVNIMLIAKCVI